MDKNKIGEKTLKEIKAQVDELFNNHVADIERAAKNGEGKVDLTFKVSLAVYSSGYVEIGTAISFTAEKIKGKAESVTIMENQEELPGIRKIA